MFIERYLLQTLSKTVSSFSVQVTPIGFVRLWYLDIAYFAIDKLFPHHLNCFDNVPVDYNSTDTLVTNC